MAHTKTVKATFVAESTGIWVPGEYMQNKDYEVEIFEDPQKQIHIFAPYYRLYENMDKFNECWAFVSLFSTAELISNAQAKKVELDRAIFALITKFHKETGFDIPFIKVHRLINPFPGKLNCLSIECEVKL